MREDGDVLSGADMVLIAEALDAYIGTGESYAPYRSLEDSQRFAEAISRRHRIKVALKMSFYAEARTWLESELRRERIDVCDKLHSRFAELLRDPHATRRTLTEGFVAAIREIRETRQSKPLPLSDR